MFDLFLEPNNFFSIGIVSLAFLVLLALATVIWRGQLEFLPSICWVSLLLIPFSINFSIMHDEIRFVHAFGVLLFLSALLFSDWVSSKISQIKSRETVSPCENTQRISFVLFITFVCISTWHVVSAESIPILTLFEPDLNLKRLMEQRLQFTRNADVSIVEQYIFNFSIMVFGVPALLIFLSNRRYVLALILFFWLLFYAVMSSAKTPIVLVFASVFIWFLFEQTKLKKFAILRTSMILVIVSVTSLFAISSLDRFGGLMSYYDEAVEFAHVKKESVPLSDYARHSAYRNRDVSLIVKGADYIVYRVFMTPVDVSAKWYEYFSKYPASKIHVSRSIVDSRTGKKVHPASLIGEWYYAEKFPLYYGKGTRASASIDADAYARFGFWGIVLVGLIFGALRIILCWLHLNQGPVGLALYCSGLALLSMLPPSASLQAILVPQGLAMILLLMISLNLRQKWLRLAWKSR